MKFRTMILIAASLLLLGACDNDPGAGKERAVVAAPVAKAPEPAAAVAKDTVSYGFSEKGSSIQFVGAKITRKHDGGFGKFKGTFKVPAGDITHAKVEVNVDASSIHADVEKLTGHLKSPDFFDVAKFPTVTFTSTAITAGGTGEATHTVTGDLTMHGVTKSLSFPATISTTPNGAKVSAEFVLNRKDFGIVYPGMPDDLIKDDVLIKIELQAAAE